MQLVGERRALAALAFAFYFLLYLLLAIADPAPGMAKAMYALAGTYGLAFLGVVASYFWARWYAMGVGLYGVITMSLAVWYLGPEPLLVFFGATHLVAVISLSGAAMAARYEGQSAWREKRRIDDATMRRIGRIVTLVGAVLPFVVQWGLAPEHADGALPVSADLLALAAIALAGVVPIAHTTCGPSAASAAMGSLHRGV